MLILLGLIIVGLATAVLLGLGQAASLRRTSRDGVLGGLGGSAALVAGIAVVVGVALFAVVGVIGIRGDSGTPEGSAGGPGTGPTTTATVPDAERASRTTAPDRPDDEEEAAQPTPAAPAGAALGPVVRLTVGKDGDREASFPVTYEAAERLTPATVLRVRVAGFRPFAEGRAEQCVTAARRECSNSIPVQFGEEGAAFFEYLVSDGFAVAARQGRCRAGAAPCSVVVTARDAPERAEIQTVFHDTLPPPGRIRVTPRNLLVDGDTVTVEVEDFPPGAGVRAMLCVPPDATGAERCGPPGPTAPITVGSDGTGRTELVIRTGAVGSERLPCRRGHPCGVSVASETVFARASVVPITFAAPPGTAYDATRLASGLGVAALFVALALWLVRRTDWSPVGEAAAPEIDDVEYADLDAIIAALPPEPDEEELANRA